MTFKIGEEIYFVIPCSPWSGLSYNVHQGVVKKLIEDGPYLYCDGKYYFAEEDTFKTKGEAQKRRLELIRIKIEDRIFRMSNELFELVSQKEFHEVKRETKITQDSIAEFFRRFT